VRSVVGDCSRTGDWLNAITPTESEAGTLAANDPAARAAALRRLGDTSLAAIELETSVASMIEAWRTDSATLCAGRAAATTSAVNATSTATSGR